VSDDLEGVAYAAKCEVRVSSAEPDPAKALWQLELRQGEMERLVEHLETSLVRLRAALQENGQTLEVLSRRLRGREGATLNACLSSERH